MAISLSRRRLFAGATALIAAPAIVHVSTLMPISAPKVRFAQRAAGSFTEAEIRAIAESMLRSRLESMRSFTLTGIDRTPLPWWKNSATA